MSRQRERGATMVLVVVGLFALIAMAGLAVDTAHVLLNKSRLQGALDAAALAAAKVLDQTSSTAQATTAAGSVFTLNVTPYPELQRAVGNGLAMTTQYSSTLSPFSPGTTPALFVRTSITGFSTTMSLISVLGIGSMTIAGTAVAGPSPAVVTACNVAPVFVCSTAAPTAGAVFGLNQVAGSSTIGPGNYGLLAMGGNGAATVRTNLAGDYASCATIGNSIPTEPGVAAGPVSQGINTRFNIYKGPVSPANYPPDVINSAAHQTNLTSDKNNNVLQGGTIVTQASQLTFSYNDTPNNYVSLVAAGTFDTQPVSAGGDAEPGRRIVAVPYGDCTGAANGKNSVPVSGFACVFLLQAVAGGSNDIIYAEMLKTCDVDGTVGPGAGANGPHRIELYKSAGSPDS